MAATALASSLTDPTTAQLLTLQFRLQCAPRWKLSPVHMPGLEYDKFSLL